MALTLAPCTVPYPGLIVSRVCACAQIGITDDEGERYCFYSESTSIGLPSSLDLSSLLFNDQGVHRPVWLSRLGSFAFPQLPGEATLLLC